MPDNLIGLVYPKNMYYFYTINNMKLKNFMDAIDLAYNNTKNITKDKNLEIIDSELISNMRSICVKFFFLSDSITQTGDSSIEERKEMLTSHVRPQLQSLLKEEDARNIETVIPPLITKLVESNFDKVFMKTDKKILLKKLNIIKQKISNDNLKFFTNTYYDAQMKLKEILELIYLYITKDENIDSYQTSYFTSEQQRKIQLNAKESFKRLNQKSYVDETTLDTLVKYIMVKFNSKM